MALDPTRELVDQIEFHWHHQLRSRLDGLSDAEYFWQPVTDVWTIRPRSQDADAAQPGSGPWTIDFAFPEPDPAPAPVTTIAWRLSHILVGVLGARIAGHFGGEPCDDQTYDYPGAADEALARLDALFAQWVAGVRGWDAEALAVPVGDVDRPSTPTCPGPRWCCTSIAS